MRIIFFDDACGFCQKWVKRLIKWDIEKQFFFSPLTGRKADSFFQGKKAKYKTKNSLILVEDKAIWIRSKAIFRVFYLLGGFWKCLGIFYLLPAFLIDPFYIFIARHRHLFKACKAEHPFIPSDRFIP